MKLLITSLRIFPLFFSLIPADLERLIDPSITEAENALLSRISEADEIKKVVQEINSHKAPGPNGFPSLFFKKYWDTVRSQVIAAVQSFFREASC